MVVVLIVIVKLLRLLFVIAAVMVATLGLKYRIWRNGLYIEGKVFT